MTYQCVRTSYHCVDPGCGNVHVMASAKEVVNEDILMCHVEEDIERQPWGTASTLGADVKEPK